MALPEAPAHTNEDPAIPPHRRSARGLGGRLAADVKSVIDLLGWAAGLYAGRAGSLLWLAGLLVLPITILESCVSAGIVSRATTISLTATTVDFSARKAELAARIQESQSRQRLDGQAVAELAALTVAETAHVPVPKLEVQRSGGWLRERLVLFLGGLLVLGLAFPLTSGLLALALYDRESGGANPGWADVWPILVARSRLLVATLLPAAVLVALGHALYVVPGLVVSVLILFLPHVVLFERRGGREGFLRGVALARRDWLRLLLTFLAFALAAAVLALTLERLVPVDGSRAAAFLYFILRDVATLAVLPIPALVLARLYQEARAPEGGTAENLARAARV